MTALAGDLLGVWLGATAACSALLAVVVAGQAAYARVRRAGGRHRTRHSTSRPAGPTARR